MDFDQYLIPTQIHAQYSKPASEHPLHVALYNIGLLIASSEKSGVVHETLFRNHCQLIEAVDTYIGLVEERAKTSPTS